MSTELWCIRAGQVRYAEACAVQRCLEAARHAGALPDLLLLLEHPPVYTKGRRSAPDELPMGEGWYRTQGIEVTDTDRGGRVTYHGPGQLVGYPIVSLRPYADDVHDYTRRMERVMTESLEEWGVEAQVIDGLTGVWTAGAPPIPAGSIGPQGTEIGGDTRESGTAEARKIGAIGIHVNRGITTHGLAINVNNDLQPFEWIVPCGIGACRMTSLCRELGATQDLHAFATTVRDCFGEIYEREPVEVSAEELAEQVDGVDPLEASPPIASAVGNGTPARVRL